MLSRYLLSALLLSTASVVVGQQASAGGYVQISNGFVRAQGNANVNLNKQIIRQSQLIGFPDYAAFITTKIYLSVNGNANGSAGAGLGGVFAGGNANGSVSINATQSIVWVAAAPLPNAASTQSSLSFNLATFSFNTQSHAVAFPYAVEYNETNNVDGFQLNQDGLVQVFDLRSTPLFGGFGSLAFSTEQDPINATANATVNVITSCSTAAATNGFCFVFRFSNSTYTRNGTTFLPDSVKIDFIANLTLFTNQKNRLALTGAVVSTADTLKLADFHAQVDATAAMANSIGGVAVCTPDFVVFPSNVTSSTTVSVTNGSVSNFNGAFDAGYLNFARTAVLTTNGTTSTTNVNAQVIFNATLTNQIQSTLDATAYNTLSLTFSFMNQASGNFQYIVFSFLNAPNGAQTLTWDPEVGTTSVSPANYVAASGSLSAGAVAGIVIGVLAVVGIIGFFGYRKMQQKKQGTSPLLG